MFNKIIFFKYRTRQLKTTETILQNVAPSDRSSMVDPLSYFSFQPVLHNWCNKGCGMCYPVCGMMH